MAWDDFAIGQTQEGLSREFSQDLKRLVGRLCTLLEATLPDVGQCKATKDMVKNIVYEDFAEHFHMIMAEYFDKKW